jgi:uncharacterized protein (TIGR03790 family)
MRRYYLLFAGLFFSGLTSLFAADGEQVVVVYNRNVPESKEVAQYYARMRQVPADQVFGFAMAKPDHISRTQYREQLERPLLKKLESSRLMVFEKMATTNSEGAATFKFHLTDSKIRYAVLCYGMPYIIAEDTNIVETAAQKLNPNLRRNEAGVDSELACLPLAKNGYLLAGFIPNPSYLATNPAALHPLRGPLMVTRLDGPSAAIARGLVDKAMQAERDGLWGRAYFDARGLTNGSYLVGDEWMRAAAQASRHAGFETVLDEASETFPVAYPLSQVALYAGWYDWQVSGPFTRVQVEFMPGAFAYHLHSFSANALRDPARNWVGPLLEKGATATMGCVLEPFLETTPDLGCFFSRFLRGFTFGEAAYASWRTLSWQIVAIGDPLYRPAAKSPREWHEDLERRQSKYLEWSQLRIVVLNEAKGVARSNVIEYLEQVPLTRASAVLSEKLAEVCQADGQKDRAIGLCRQALLLAPSPQQKIRLMLTLSRWLAEAGREREAMNTLLDFQKTFTDYPSPLEIWRDLLPLAEKLGDTHQVSQCRQEILRLESKR